MKILGNRGLKATPNRLAAIALVAVFSLLTACGGGDSPFGESSDGSSGSGSGGGSGATGGVATATMMTGALDWDLSARVINAAFSVLDADGNAIEHLDGGDFEIFHGSTSGTDMEGFWDAQRLTYPGQVAGRIILMMDVSTSMASAYAFQDYVDQAARLVEEMHAYGLDVHAYKFSDEMGVDADAPAFPTPVGDVLATDGAAQLSTVTTAIKSLVPEDSSATRFYKIISSTIDSLASPPAPARPWSEVVYQHDPLGTPGARVELMVIMSDGRDSTGNGGSQDIIDAKDRRFNVVSIATGENPDVDGLETISEYLFQIPENGAYADAVNAAISQIKRYYASFYLVDYMPPALEGTTDENYAIKLVGNDITSINVTYPRDGFPDSGNVPARCCKLRVNPSVDLSAPVVIKPGETVELTAVKLWTGKQPVYTWTFAGDGNMSIDDDAIDTAIISSNKNPSSASVSVDAVSEGWSQGPITIQAQ
jgi:hypothetical protein